MAAKAAHRPGVAFINLGCRVNRVETDLIASQLTNAGCEVCGVEEADLIVINTCAVTGEAQAKTRKAARHACGLPQRPIVIACGCAASLFADELRTAAPRLVVEPCKDAVAHRALELLGMAEGAPLDGSGQAEGTGSHRASPSPLAPTVSLTPTGRVRPGIKIQDGCDNRCTYCIVWKARGPSRALPSEDVVSAVREACARGAHEVVLTGINLGSYRAPQADPLGEGATLDALLAELLEQTTIDRLRISSIEPPDVNERLLTVMAGSDGRIAPFLHVCLQSGCDQTLQRMGRLYTTTEFSRMVSQARSYLPAIAIETDVIAGFPGETDVEFASSYDFCKSMGFSRMHVFRYSRRPGTPAATYPNQVAPTTLAERAATLRKLARQMRQDAARSLDGITDNLLVIEPTRAVGGHLFDIVVPEAQAVGSYLQATLKFNSNLNLSAEIEQVY